MRNDVNEVVSNEVKAFKNPSTPFSEFCFECLESIIQVLVVLLIIITPFFRVMNVSGDSMLNTLHDHDKLFVWRWNYTPADGDVVTITRGQYFDEPIVKRVIATQGQTLSINFNDGSVTVDGVKLNETYIKEPMWLEEDGVIPAVVPMGYCFVMGDNRNHSSDSRSKEIGLIKNEDVIGKVLYIIFPFQRIGKVN